MGYMRHHAIVVTGNGKHLEAAHDRAVQLGMTVSAVERSDTNCVESFCVFPDGSKEGWERSDEGDSQRDALISGLSREWLQWVEVQYGDDERRTFVTRHSDE
jgi:hypothetical protein